jgi:glyoxylase-like metal-dependent hydrolase (beta-lactamase superfamily II)
MKGPAEVRFSIVPVTPFAQNCSVVWCEQTGAGAVVDPGGDIDRILAVVRSEGVKLQKILLTHAHLDHAGGAGELARTLGLPIEGPHTGDQFWIDGLEAQARMFGIRSGGSFVPDRWLEDGDRVQVGDMVFEVMHCPGHTPGHVVFHSPAQRLAFVGDVLFAGSIGRTDFPGGDYGTLINVIRTRLFPLGDDVRFVPGHGPMSTFGAERLGNPFVGDAAIGAGR